MGDVLVSSLVKFRVILFQWVCVPIAKPPFRTPDSASPPPMFVLFGPAGRCGQFWPRAPRGSGPGR